MKRLILFTFLLSIYSIGFSQNHMKFIGIPMGGAITPFTDEMIAKGFTPYRSGTINYAQPDDPCCWQNFTGDFWEFNNVFVLVRSYLNDKGVSFVEVQFAYANRERFNRLISTMDKKYGKHSYIENESEWGTYYIWKLAQGRVEICRTKFDYEDNKCELTITYKDYTLAKREDLNKTSIEKKKASHQNDL